RSLRLASPPRCWRGRQAACPRAVRLADRATPPGRDWRRQFVARRRRGKPARENWPVAGRGFRGGPCVDQTEPRDGRQERRRQRVACHFKVGMTRVANISPGCGNEEPLKKRNRDACTWQASRFTRYF